MRTLADHLTARPKRWLNELVPTMELSRCRAYFVNVDLSHEFPMHVMCFRHGLCGHRTSSNSVQFRKPLVVAYYDVDYVKNAKGTNYWRNRWRNSEPILRRNVPLSEQWTWNTKGTNYVHCHQPSYLVFIWGFMLTPFLLPSFADPSDCLSRKTLLRQRMNCHFCPVFHLLSEVFIKTDACTME